ncbi:hypothetical protein M422DRAFT_245712 [Sphaerobolus stellatus SS14]|nr:hypothetical protein M422DRAFT_245712 [Sphaerobolus stellatus SS14]
MLVIEAFTSVPVLDYSLVKTDKQKFLIQLRHALVYVGFLYLSNHTVPQELVDSLISYVPRLFALTQEEKDSIAMRNSQHFLGYNRFGSEFTKGATDLREQFDFASQHKNRWTPGAPEYLRLWGDAQAEEVLPGFRATTEAYIKSVEELSFEFTSLVAEALGLPPDALDRFYDEPKSIMQQRCKIVKYPTVTSGSKQGVGPHYDAGFLTFHLHTKASKSRTFAATGSQPVPSRVHSSLTSAKASKRPPAVPASQPRIASSPDESEGPRYSVPIFQNISQTVRVCDNIVDLPAEIVELVKARGHAATDSVNFSEYNSLPSGLVNLIGRVKSHPDVAARHYPELFKKYFPNGLPAQGSAY